jgi:hypothetical protein
MPTHKYIIQYIGSMHPIVAAACKLRASEAFELELQKVMKKCEDRYENFVGWIPVERGSRRLEMPQDEVKCNPVLSVKKLRENKR